jgi:hypothetical protein
MRFWQLFFACVVTVVAATGSPAVEKSFTDFHEWFLASGGVAPKLRLQTFADMGTGLQALSAVVEGEEVISVPMDLVMCVLCTGDGTLT